MDRQKEPAGRAGYAAGIDIGSFGVRLVIIDGNHSIAWKDRQVHHGNPAKGVRALLERLPAPFRKQPLRVMLTGTPGKLAAGIETMGDIPAIQRGAALLYPKAGSVMEVGAQHGRFLTGLDTGKAPQYAVNEGCAGGTGAFFEDQMYRLGLNLEDYSRLTRQAMSVPRLSGRCSVFAKTDIIHRQQEGVPVPDILLGLCYAAVKNFKAAIVSRLPVERPMALCGGIVHNEGVIRAVKELFELEENELFADAAGEYLQAAGAALAGAESGSEDGPRRLWETLEKQEEQKQRSEPQEVQGQGGNLREAPGQEGGFCRLPALAGDPSMAIPEPVCKGLSERTECCLGIDVGSTSTNLVLTDEDGNILDFQYLRTKGDPQAAVEEGMKAIMEKSGSRALIRSIGVTGSGRYLIGKKLGADLVVDEITAQEKAAAWVCPDADTVFEIGGQDSKYIRLRGGKVQDFQMNKICAAGTGSFLEEQAGRMGVSLEKYGQLALAAKYPVDLGERCSVFIESSVGVCLAQGVDQGDILAGLCYSVIYNYLHKVVGNKPVGEHIVLQGGVCYDSAVVAAFRSVYGSRVQVSPCFAVSGAYGAALLAQEKLQHGRGKDMPEDTKRFLSFYRKPKELFMNGYTRELGGKKPVVGIPYVLLVHKFFPMFRTFFEELGCEVLLSPETDESIIALAQSFAQEETCYPVKLMYGHMAWLAGRKPDYLFLPAVLTMKHESSRVHHNYGCVYMQTAMGMIYESMGLGKKGMRLLNPVFNLDFGQQAMAGEMIGIGRNMGYPAEICRQALMKASMAVRSQEAKVEALGKELLEGLKPEEKILVMITRNYGIEDPVLNMGIPEELIRRGYKVITLSHLPAHNLDLSGGYDNLYWPFGQHIISGAKLVAAHPNLYAVYLTNHGCGPDTMLSHLFRREMGEKPYLAIEVDEHFSKVGVITRIEAFLNSLEVRENEKTGENGKELFDIRLQMRQVHMARRPKKGKRLILPRLDPYGKIIARRLKSLGYEAECIPETNAGTLAEGRKRMMSKEYLPFTALTGAAVETAAAYREPFQLMIPQTEGSETDGMYARVIYEFLRDAPQAELVGPMAETLPWEQEPEVFGELFEGVLEGDRLLREQAFGTESESGRTKNKRIFIMGDPYLVYDPFLNFHLAEKLKHAHVTAVPMPLGEYLAFLWRQRAGTEEQKRLAVQCERRLAQAMGEFYVPLEQIEQSGRQIVGVLSGGNGLYRAGRRQCAAGFDGIIELAPMYENTQTVIDLCGRDSHIPLLSLRLEESGEMAADERVKSFLYYL